MSKKIVIFCSDDAHHKYLVSLLSLRFNIVAVVIEKQVNQWLRLLHTKKYKDFFYSLYHYLRRKILGLDAYRRHYFTQDATIAQPVSYQAITVRWINELSVVNLLREIKPDLTVVIGTSIIHEEVLNAAGEIILNIHGGYLPDYRGNHCFFFAIYNEEFDKIGSTIHWVDSGIDTGSIVEVVVPPIYPNDTAEKLYCRAEMMAIHRLIHWVEYLEQGGTLPRIPQIKRCKLYRTCDRKPYHDLNLWLRRISGQLVIPNIPSQNHLK